MSTPEEIEANGRHLMATVLREPIAMACLDAATKALDGGANPDDVVDLLREAARYLVATHPELAPADAVQIALGSMVGVMRNERQRRKLLAHLN